MEQIRYVNTIVELPPKPGQAVRVLKGPPRPMNLYIDFVAHSFLQTLSICIITLTSGRVVKTIIMHTYASTGLFARGPGKKVLLALGFFESSLRQSL